MGKSCRFGVTAGICNQMSNADILETVIKTYDMAGMGEQADQNGSPTVPCGMLCCKQQEQAPRYKKL